MKLSHLVLEAYELDSKDDIAGDTQRVVTAYNMASNKEEFDRAEMLNKAWQHKYRRSGYAGETKGPSLETFMEYHSKGRNAAWAARRRLGIQKPIERSRYVGQGASASALLPRAGWFERWMRGIDS